MRNKYVVAFVTENVDLYFREFDDYDAALSFVESSGDKALIIRVENICDQSISHPTTVKVESHT